MPDTLIDGDLPLETLAQTLTELVADERTYEIFCALVDVFETARDFHTQQHDYGMAGDFAHRASVIREYFCPKKGF